MPKGKADAVRTCLGCRSRKTKKEMLRIVGGPEGEACFDLGGRLPGRGAYVCPEQSCLAGLKASSLQHTLKMKITLPPLDGLCSLLVRSLEGQLEGILTIGRKAGKILYGADSVIDALEAGKGKLLLTAANTSERTLARIDRSRGSVPSITLANRETLGRLFGRGAVSVALVTSGGMAKRLSDLADRLTAVKMRPYHELN